MLDQHCPINCSYPNLNNQLFPLFSVWVPYNAARELAMRISKLPILTIVELVKFVLLAIVNRLFLND